MELSEYEQQETQYAEIDKQLAIFNEKLLQMASSLSAKRVAAAKKLSQELTNQLQQLNMKGSLVSIELLKLNEITPHGLDQLVFKVQTNPGEGTP
jgi:DNA repair protein RecN (Recombination protein N)